VLLTCSSLGRAFGHPIYDPIFKAAAEVGLPIAIHTGGEFTGDNAHYQAGGVAGSRFELEAGGLQPVQHHLVSLIVHGVFERYPDLKVLLAEYGVTWLPHLLYQMDANYDLMRRESPWVKKWPSEYFREHVFVTTQPFESTITSRQLSNLYTNFEYLQDVLCFSTDYPHWDTEDATIIRQRLPESWHDNVFYRNALRFYGWKESELLEQAAAVPS
jgi:predicted TIM-barrel fold metal-dependent hydrolase